MKLPVVLCALILCHGLVTAQPQLQFHSQNYAGFLAGDNGSYFQFQSINGIQRGSWFTGMGTGLDHYVYRSIPLFLSVNKDLKPASRTFYLSANGGTNFAWLKNDTKPWGVIDNHFSPGLFWGTGFGYKALFKNQKDAMLINVGYSYKQIKEEQHKAGFCPNPPCADIIERYDYRLKRISVMIGWQF